MTQRPKKYYKLARPDGWDFYTGKTINYRNNIGFTVNIQDAGYYQLCSNSVIHASRNPNNCFVGAKIPCSAYEVWGKPVIEDNQKAGFVSLKIKREITDLDNLFGWRYSEAVNPIHPFKISPPKKITKRHKNLVKEWESVWGSVPVWVSVGDSVWVSVRDSVGDSVGVSVRASVGAYIGSLFFPHIKKWKYITHKKGVYPFQPAVDLWKQGLVPSYDGKTWRLHGGPKGEVLWEDRFHKCLLTKWALQNKNA